MNDYRQPRDSNGSLQSGANKQCLYWNSFMVQKLKKKNNEQTIRQWAIDNFRPANGDGHSSYWVLTYFNALVCREAGRTSPFSWANFMAWFKLPKSALGGSALDSMALANRFVVKVIINAMIVRMLKRLWCTVALCVTRSFNGLKLMFSRLNVSTCMACRGGPSLCIEYWVKVTIFILKCKETMVNLFYQTTWKLWII